ncbi:sodium/hydrogen exchanger [Nostoc commune NIES-4072]|uniref:Sodium/hydrogen exchanger n=1 Tax=Nostoc commune NIES-4072 TaxID=2005467 RepID=A0A2R5FQB0_NOSCO|nr:hypothetical protein [Nostoc commune]BBD68060.1 sodium/hydrogen exchanger [Nostoc commune HK-02]GBG20946.1 sodium/hydrogen exchanger [Nostoc commune NIES-4072]
MDVTQLVKVSIILLLLATGVALLSRRLRIPYVTGLVLAALNEAIRKRILSEEIVCGRIQNLDEQLLKLEDD